MLHTGTACWWLKIDRQFCTLVKQFGLKNKPLSQGDHKPSTTCIKFNTTRSRGTWMCASLNIINSFCSYRLSSRSSHLSSRTKLNFLLHCLPSVSRYLITHYHHPASLPTKKCEVEHVNTSMVSSKTSRMIPRHKDFTTPMYENSKQIFNLAKWTWLNHKR